MHEAPISVVTPIDQALRWTQRVLFQPFAIDKWFTLGFCAWLAWLGEGGGSIGSNWNLPGRGGDSGFNSAGDWVREHVALVIAIVVVVGVLVLAILVLCLWLSSRAKFMFLDGVLRDRGAVVEPWHRFRERGNALFRFRLLLALVALPVFGLLVAGAAACFWAFRPLLTPDLGGSLALLVLFLTFWIGLFLLVGLAFGLVALGTHDFVVPIMWQRDCAVLEAWSVLRGELKGRAGVAALYVLMKILLALGIGIIACLAACVTCCVAALPYIGTVLLLPLYVFQRSYSIYFFSQFGGDWAALAPPLPADAPPASPADEPPPPPADDGPRGALP